MFSLNIVKLFLIGYFCLIVIGDSLVNIFDKIGYYFVKINYFGDWGK